MKYTFGVDDAGARRLENLAGFFNPLAEAFIRHYLDQQPRQSAVDLGCGPGFTTNMLARVSRCATTYGLDSAEHFIQIAKSRFPDYVFMQHNLTQLPFPVQADVMYVRFVLSHLSHPVDTVNQWLTALKPGGLLFIDETETVECDVDVFQQYEAANASMIAAQGAQLWVGSILAEGHYNAEIVASTCDIVPVANHQAATWFLPNVQTVWQTSPFMQNHLSADQRQRIGAEIARISESGDSRCQNTWKMRRMVLRRR